MAIEGYIIKQDFSAVEQLVYEVNKIGNNINQIARRANEMEYVSLDDMKYLKKQLYDISFISKSKNFTMGDDSIAIRKTNHDKNHLESVSQIYR
ncbi:plasmid mobilization relaxosome protein MobC [Paenibacillus solisilvae]|uniref:Plasmid mobilization relaxosome protein MobC n=1 Tax=Paenibacillus solisilvae TaxID=2486751 RepID=A0ABW0W591_9BACL